MNFTIIDWQDDKVIMIDQRKLPAEETYISHSNYEEVAESIRNMTVRGAPAIGVAAAMGLAIGAKEIEAQNHEEFLTELEKISKILFETRPTAVNLEWALKRMSTLAKSHKDTPLEQLKKILIKEAISIKEKDIHTNQKMGDFGQTLIKDGDTVLTHCNAGALATAGWGTALGVIYSAKKHGKNLKVYADETRPVLQGARLSAWELTQNEIPTTVICDNMAGSLMKKGLIDKVIVGADRIARNGDVANKIGTYPLAVLANYHKVPFYVAAPLSTIDINCPDGNHIPIEERHHHEIRHYNQKQTVPHDAEIYNPAFDVTPHELISAIITEEGILTSTYEKEIVKLFQN